MSNHDHEPKSDPPVDAATPASEAPSAAPRAKPDKAASVKSKKAASTTDKTRSSADGDTPRSRGGRLLFWALCLVVLLVIALGVALYYQDRQIRDLHSALEQQQRTNTRVVQTAQSEASEAVAQVRRQASEIGDLSERLQATSDQLRELDRALQLMTDSGSDLLLVNDVDRLVTLADQQLALGGNVANAIASLEAAQAQLARANRPGLAALQQSINGDLDRLRAVSTINVPALSAQLDRLGDLVAQAPLLVPDLASPDVAQRAPDAGSPSPPDAAEQASGEDAPLDWHERVDQAWQWTQDITRLAVHDLRSLFDVRRVDDTAALLMSPDQAQRFREGLKQRTLTAQLALMMHQSHIWRSELAQLAHAIEQRYDMRSESSRAALTLARTLHDTPIEVRLPTLDNSLSAVAAARDAAAAEEASPGTVTDEADGDARSQTGPTSGAEQGAGADDTPEPEPSASPDKTE